MVRISAIFWPPFRRKDLQASCRTDNSPGSWALSVVEATRLLVRSTDTYSDIASVAESFLIVAVDTWSNPLANRIFRQLQVHRSTLIVGFPLKLCAIMLSDPHD
jgi:hypothetical protein